MEVIKLINRTDIPTQDVFVLLYTIVQKGKRDIFCYNFKPNTTFYINDKTYLLTCDKDIVRPSFTFVFKNKNE